MTRFTPKPPSLTLPELDQVECALRAGQRPELETARRLMVTVRELQANLRMRAGRLADAEVEAR